MSDEAHSGGAMHRIDEETGKPFWELWGESWEDTDALDAGKPMTLDPTAFPPGTRIVIIEPCPDDPRAVAFYGRAIRQESLYPLKGELLDEMLELNDD
jgi:hypothetical protein